MSLAFGVIAGYARALGGFPRGLEPILLVGLLGGFTTYSSFAYQAVDLFEAGRPTAALAYVMATNLLGLSAVWAGVRLFAA